MYSVSQSIFFVKYDGANALQSHMNSGAHTVQMQAWKISNAAKSFFLKKKECNDSLISAAEIAKAYHVVQHGHSYRSSDCGIKLDSLIFSDSEIVKH